jgi:primosomal protein N' (replication factor Y)
VILFLNRRGTASFVQCRDCGYVPECKTCAVALTYHEADLALICHYCHRKQMPLAECPVCKSDRIRTIGLGTQRVEEEVHRAFPEARTLRWDRDVTRAATRMRRSSRASSRTRLMSRGTQMIAKGWTCRS